MKKRLISGACLLFAITLLLCSCTAGLPGSELVNTIKDGVGGFAAKLGNLFLDQTPLIIDGASDYAFKTDLTASADVQSAVNTVCDSVRAKTGLDLRAQIAAPRAIRVSSDAEQFPTVANKLNAAEFYIGFQGEDLLIFATSDVMLTSALSYFAKTFVEAQDANAGEGYLYLPLAFDYTAPTLAVRSEEYTLVYAFNAGERHTNYITAFHETVVNTTGARLLMKDDFVPSNNTREILVGHPNRPECKEILETLGIDEYYIGTVGEKIMILAHSNAMLETALYDFTASFISAPNASYNVQEKAWSLPSYLNKTYENKHLLLTDLENSNAVIVYPEKASSLIKNTVKEVCAHYAALTNRELHSYTDTQLKKPSDGMIEILIGDTNRPVSKATKATLPQGGWSVTVQNGKVVVVGTGDNSLRLAMNALISHFSFQADRFAPNGIYDRGSLVTGVNRALPLQIDMNLQGRSVPDLITLSKYEYINRNTYAISQKNCLQTDFNHFLSRLRNAGYVKQEGEELYYINTELSETATVTYIDGVLRVVVGKLPQPK